MWGISHRPVSLGIFAGAFVKSLSGLSKICLAGEQWWKLHWRTFPHLHPPKCKQIIWQIGFKVLFCQIQVANGTMSLELTVGSTQLTQDTALPLGIVVEPVATIFTCNYISTPTLVTLSLEPKTTIYPALGRPRYLFSQTIFLFIF